MEKQDSEIKMTPEERKKMRCDHIIGEGVLWAIWTGAIPVTIFDYLFAAAVQLRMISQLCLEYNRKFSQSAVKSYITILTGMVALHFTSHATLAGIRMIPGVGGLYGAVGLSIYAGGITYAIGKLFQQHFEKGGDLSDFNPEHVEHVFIKLKEEGIEKAKKIASSR